MAINGNDDPIEPGGDFYDHTHDPHPPHAHHITEAGMRCGGGGDCRNGTEFTGAVAFNPEVDANQRAAVNAVRVEIVDSGGGASEPLDVVLQDAVAKDLNEICNPDNAHTFCGVGAACSWNNDILDIDDNNNGINRCHQVAAECPEGWNVVNLNNHPNGNRWTYRAGDLMRNDLEEHGVPACEDNPQARQNATGFNEVYEFTAPQNGTYEIMTRTRGNFNEDADVILWARSHCAVEAANAELACVDNIAGSAQETINVEMVRDDTVYTFVDSSQPIGRCLYQIDVRRR
jgi:hypothetical protein